MLSAFIIYQSGILHLYPKQSSPLVKALPFSKNFYLHPYCQNRGSQSALSFIKGGVFELCETFDLLTSS